jgi:hypothetical protein
VVGFENQKKPEPYQSLSQSGSGSGNTQMRERGTAFALTARLPQLPVKSRSEALKLTHIRISAQGVEPVKVILFPSQIHFTPNPTACLISETFVLVSTYPMTEPDQTKNKKNEDHEIFNNLFGLRLFVSGF